MSLRRFADHLIPVYDNQEIGPFLARQRLEESRGSEPLPPQRKLSHFTAYLYPMHQPMYWRVPPGQYMSPWVRRYRYISNPMTNTCVGFLADTVACVWQAWSGFHFDVDFFLRTTTGKRILYLEAGIHSNI